MSSSILKMITPKGKDIGGFDVRRALPQVGMKSVGPWIFFDHFGPVTFAPGKGMDVRPHPHVNLATVTYLFEGEIIHRDSLGNVAPIAPGAINLMVAGKGISHSERTRSELKENGHSLHGLQLWMALPESDEETDPEFLHYGSNVLPQIDIDGASLRVMMGQGFGLTSPVKTFSPTFYAEAQMQEGTKIALPDVEELAIYVVEGEADIDGVVVPINSMAVIDMDSAKSITAKGHTRLAMIGGAPLGKRYMWWNFVSSRPERIEQAKADWQAGRFGAVPEESEFIPLPDS